MLPVEDVMDTYTSQLLKAKMFNTFMLIGLQLVGRGETAAKIASYIG